MMCFAALRKHIRMCISWIFISCSLDTEFIVCNFGGHFDRHDPHYWFYFNLEDPNERGYDAIRRLFLLEMEKEKSRFK